MSRWKAWYRTAANAASPKTIVRCVLAFARRRPLMRRKEASLLDISDNKEDLRPANPAQDDLEALESARNRFEGRATFCGAVVVFGVVLEYVPKFIELLPHWDWHLAARELLGGILIALGVAGEVLFGKMASRRESRIGAIKDLRIAELNLETENLKSARLALEKSLADVKRWTLPRSIDTRYFLDKLKGVQKQKVEIVYKAEDDEASFLALQIRRWLGPGVDGDGAGWDVPAPVPLTDEKYSLWESTDPLSTKAGSASGVGLVVKTLLRPVSLDTPVHKLAFALQASGIQANSITTDPRMPDNTIRIVIGQHLDRY